MNYKPIDQEILQNMQDIIDGKAMMSDDQRKAMHCAIPEVEKILLRGLLCANQHVPYQVPLLQTLLLDLMEAVPTSGDDLPCLRYLLQLIKLSDTIAHVFATHIGALADD